MAVKMPWDKYELAGREKGSRKKKKKKADNYFFPDP